ncbi:hypothetical protein BCV70DRAFT_216282 [Testicularia cyperi]|uniref:Uncharacterized protein n=1 Tax=Testicularia cyperi TaxID=1882483 RepID=A0A317XUG4_9BASI|nr:hypothetical protein BCV70DRAFT_216282 [Testicularia cyperi]
MEFFFPADVFAFPGHGGRCHRAAPASPFASSSRAAGCGFDSHPFFDGDLFGAIQHEQAVQAARAAQRERAEAIRRAKAARQAALEQQRRAAEERRVQAYFEHMLELQRRQELERQARIRQERQYAEYQRRKTQAIERERQRIAALRAAQEHSQPHPLFFALEDLIFGGLEAFADHLRGDEDHDNDNQAQQTQTQTQVHMPAAKPDLKGKARQADSQDEQPMEVDAPAAASVPAPASAPTTSTEADADADADPEEIGPVPASEPANTQPETESAAIETNTTETSEPATKEALVFAHEFPSTSSFDKSSVKADGIKISVDETSNKVTVSGLWNSAESVQVPPQRPSSPTPSDSSSASGSSSHRGRSRSPKRARVSDVDENGDEIINDADDNSDNDLVHVNFTNSNSNPASASASAPASASTSASQDKVEKTFTLPQGANVDSLRAQLTDSGLQLFCSVPQSQ